MDNLLPQPQTDAGASGPQPTGMSDDQFLEKWKVWKKECFDQRWVYEKQWLRNVWYILNRQWIYFDTKRGQWQDKRLAKWIPRPVTNICKEAVQSVRANFAAINYGANARPLGDDTENVITAGVADDYAPILHESHQMDATMNEFDFWLLVTGNAFLHTCIEKDIKNGTIEDPYEDCTTCGAEYLSSQIADNGQKCAECGGTEFQPSQTPPVTTPMPKGITIPLSPFEVAFPLMYERFSLTPYVVRMRWRDKSYYEQSAELQPYVNTLSFTKSPQERTMQIFKTLPFQNDLGIAAPYFASGGANTDSEGIVEYDIWVKPCLDFPKGQVIRIAGDNNPVVIHSESEALPGPLPYTDAKGNPIFTFHHARYDHVGGRALGSSLIDPIIQKQDQLNQLDSHILMVIGRMANPIWLEPKGAEVEKFTGEPGLVVKWNPLVGGATGAKPERIPGEGINPSVFQYRQMIKQEAEELSGTYDILKGQKPAGVEAFAALNLLVERGQARHASAYQERGACYKGWFHDALELEREFGPDERIKAILQPTKGWAFETFKRAQLGGAVEIIIEDGTLTPKTSLGERAAIEHLRQLGLLNPSDPDQVMAIYQKFGQSRLLPGLDAQVQEAGLNMSRFEKFMGGDPATVQLVQQQMAAAQQQALLTGVPPATIAGPLTYKRWYNPQIHRQELVKWCLSDRGRDIFQKNPAAEQYVDAYLATIDLAITQAQMGMLDASGQPMPAPTAPGGPGSVQPGQGQQPSQPGGAGAAMANSNRNAAGAGPGSSGAAGAKANGQQDKSGQPTTQAADERAISFLEAHGMHA